MAKLNAEKISAVAAFVDMILAMLGKKPKASDAAAAFGKKKEMVGDYLAGCATLQTAADAGLGLGNPDDPANYLTPGQVKAIAAGDDLMVKAARKIQKTLA